MKPISFEEHKQVQLEILVNFAEFCEGNNLKYFLAFGSLIGAVRHKGFIPWDDDIDVWMPRPDYDRFIQIFREKNKNKDYCICVPGEKNSKHSFVKMYNNRSLKIESGVKYDNDYLGIDIDIWPLDALPDDYKEYKRVFKELKFQYLLFFARISSLNYGSLVRRFKVLLLKSICGTKKQILAKADKIHNRYTYDNAKFIGTVICYFDYIEGRFEKEWFDDFVMLDFEGKKFRVPVEYDKVLTEQYGDYMTPPPAEQQIPHHKNNVFWKE